MQLKNLQTAFAVVLLALCGASVQATAETRLVDATDPFVIFQQLRGFGTVEMDADDAGDPMIVGRMEGIQYVVHFYGCTDNVDCRSLQFRAAWTDDGIPLEFINGWNRDWRFGKVYLDDEDDPVIEMNVNLFGGVSEKNLRDTIDWWRVVIKQFRDDLSEVSRESAL